MGNPIAYAKICANFDRIVARTPMMYGARRIHGNELRICCRHEERVHCMLQQVIREAQAAFAFSTLGTYRLRHLADLLFGIRTAATRPIYEDHLCDPKVLRARRRSCVVPVTALHDTSPP